MHLIKRLIPARLKKHLKKYLRAPSSFVSLVRDFFDAAERRKNMIPPRRMDFVGGGDFRAIGIEFKGLFTDYGGLKPDDRVLDVGSGIGRMAGPLTSFLSSSGSYEGFDIVKLGVEWCQKNISSRFPNFHFQHSNLRNKQYNPGGIYDAITYRFPYETASFDFVFLTSVFTHMFPLDVENYLNEISRVLRTGGKCFATFFLINQESESLIHKMASTLDFSYEMDGYFTTTPENPEAAIAFDETYIRNLFGRCNLSMNDPVHYGSWCGRPKFVSYQDIVVATRDSSPFRSSPETFPL